jgi:hypothetical protein
VRKVRPPWACSGVSAELVELGAISASPCGIATEVAAAIVVAEELAPTMQVAPSVATFRVAETVATGSDWLSTASTVASKSTPAFFAAAFRAATPMRMPFSVEGP